MPIALFQCIDCGTSQKACALRSKKLDRPIDRDLHQMLIDQSGTNCD
ncbi:MAG: hypothetical protein ABI180_09650 [Microcoleus sp.]